jgi:acyl-CoA reductase-like NAD-dependent aldehyde dehydrogenase
LADRIRCISPVDGSLYAERKPAKNKAVHNAFRLARLAQDGWKRRSIEERAGFCLRAVDAMLAMKDEIVPELAWQMGRPVRYGAGELRGFEERARYMVSIAAQALKAVDPGPKDGFVRYIRREPVGVVFTVAPWNYPYLTAVNSIIPALMAGNSVVLKHAAQTILVGERFAKAFAAAGLPEGVFQNLVMTHDQTADAISNRRADMVCFTGSVAGGKAMEEAAAGQFIHVGLELGGKDPATRSKTWWTAHSSTPASRAAASNASTSTRRCGNRSSRVSSISQASTCSAPRSTRRPRSGRW